MQDEFLFKRLEERKEQHSFRSLKIPPARSIDFCSNDYLGIVRNKLLARKPTDGGLQLRSGSTGSRLLSGNYEMIEEAEKVIAAFHQAQASLLFNSGYDANLGLLSCVPQRNDVIFFDSLSHASIRDGIRLSFATSHSFQHNDLVELEKKLQGVQEEKSNRFVVTESVFSMDGDYSPLRDMVMLCKKYGANLIVDEAHATGVVGNKGEGLVQQLQLQNHIFARVHTFGKALGTHGAVVLGSSELRDYLINFCRPFIYTTSLPETSIHDLLMSYEIFPTLNNERQHLERLINVFQQLSIRYEKLTSSTAIQGVIVPGNEEARSLASRLQEKNFDIRAILYPTVPKGMERLRIVLHAFNTEKEIEELVKQLL